MTTDAKTPETLDEWLATIPEAMLIASEDEDFARRLAVLSGQATDTVQ